MTTTVSPPWRGVPVAPGADVASLVIKAIATLDNLDKGINLFSQKVREWYGWHFPELYAIVSDNLNYARLVLFIGNKSTLGEDKLHELAALVDEDEEKASEVISKAKISMGRDISDVDMDVSRAAALTVRRMGH